MFETEIHRVYTEQTSPVLSSEFHHLIACEDENEFSDEYEELILTTVDSNITCKLCLEKIGGKRGRGGHLGKGGR